MGKGLETRSMIIDAATELFSKRGYLGVSMSDVCEKTQLSRGGLYRHFSSVSELFIAVLKQDCKDSDTTLSEAIFQGYSAVKLLDAYFSMMEQDILNGSGRLSLCVYEYLRSVPVPDPFIVQRFPEAVRMLETLILYGIKRHEVSVSEPLKLAEHLVVSIDGLGIAFTALQDPQLLHRQFIYLRSLFGGVL